MAKAQKKILIIDDANLVRLYYRHAFEAAGFAVDEALNGIEAMEKLLVEPADLLIVDINMPQMDGITFLGILRGEKSGVGLTPAIVISTESGLPDRESARSAGANFYFVKPVSPEVLTQSALLLSGAAP